MLQNLSKAARIASACVWQVCLPDPAKGPNHKRQIHDRSGIYESGTLHTATRPYTSETTQHRCCPHASFPLLFLVLVDLRIALFRFAAEYSISFAAQMAAKRLHTPLQPLASKYSRSPATLGIYRLHPRHFAAIFCSGPSFTVSYAVCSLFRALFAAFSMPLPIVSSAGPAQLAPLACQMGI